MTVSSPLALEITGLNKAFGGLKVTQGVSSRSGRASAV